MQEIADPETSTIHPRQQNNKEALILRFNKYVVVVGGDEEYATGGCKLSNLNRQDMESNTYREKVLTNCIGIVIDRNASWCAATAAPRQSSAGN